jgi:hypothetical protein
VRFGRGGGLRILDDDARRGARRQLAPERASLAGDTLDAERALHQLCQSLGDHQSYSRAGHARRFLPEAVERLEQLRQLFWR